MNTRHAQKGFTLAELVVATTLMSIVMIGVYTTFHSAILHWRTGSANEKTFTDARRIFTILEHDLSGIPNDRYLVDATRYFIGDDDELVFASVIRPMNVEEEAVERLHLVSYSFSDNLIYREEAPIDGTIAYRAFSFGDISDDQSLELGRPYKRAIADDVLDVRFTYLWTPPPPESNQTPVWVDLIERSACTSRLPAGLRIDIALHDPAKDPGQPYSQFTKTIKFDGVVSNLPEDLATIEQDLEAEGIFQ